MRRKENSRARFGQIHHDLAQGVIYCGLFTLFLYVYILFSSVTGRHWFSLLAFHECLKALLTKQNIFEPLHVYSYTKIPLSCFCTQIIQQHYICIITHHIHPFAHTQTCTPCDLYFLNCSYSRQGQKYRVFFKKWMMKVTQSFRSPCAWNVLVRECVCGGFGGGLTMTEVTHFH